LILELDRQCVIFVLFFILSKNVIDVSEFERMISLLYTRVHPSYHRMNLQLPAQSVPIITNIVSWSPRLWQRVLNLTLCEKDC